LCIIKLFIRIKDKRRIGGALRSGPGKRLRKGDKKKKYAKKCKEQINSGGASDLHDD
jgi:hypothetical protein